MVEGEIDSCKLSSNFHKPATHTLNKWKGFKIGSDKTQGKFYLSICFRQNTSIFTSSKRFLSKIDKCSV